MFNVRLAVDHCMGNGWLLGCPWSCLCCCLILCCSFLPQDVLDEIWGGTESVPQNFPYCMDSFISFALVLAFHGQFLKENYTNSKGSLSN